MREFNFVKMNTVLIIAFSAAAVLQSAVALCPGESPCSGHGTCGAWDKCNCYRNWQGNSCADRTCPHHKAWADIKDTAVSNRHEHYYAECSAKGICDRKTGTCECFEGFEGKGCQRMSCPESCNGHGTCELMVDMNTGYSAWDSDKIQVCKCDPGFQGIACEKRSCKPGDDPLTLQTIDTLTYQENEVQTLKFDDNGGAALTGSFVIKYTDWRGETWNTHPINIATASAISVEEALEALPNNPIPSITVSKTGAGAASGAVTFTITFDDEATPGDQQPLSLEIVGCVVDGCQPVYPALTSSGTTTAVVQETTKGTEELDECSNRGKCDYEVGTCVCENGYYGEACQGQTIIM